MSGIDIERVLIRRLLALPNRWPARLPNGGGTTGAKRYVVEGAAASQIAEGVSTATEVMREMNIRVEIPENGGSAEADDEAKRVAAWFPKDSVLEGFVSIDELPNVRPGYNADGLYIVPVLVRGRAFF